MHSREIRRGFLEYFQRNGHTIVPSSSLVPGDDPTLLFTNAGMNQFKDTFLGREKRAYTRATTSQKCMRVSGKHNDLDNVGPSLRHHTFFEMLGNFSFGDYFKKEAIPFAWDLLTTVWQLPADQLYPTIFKGEAGIPRDEEAYTIWTKLVPAARITELGLAENFWAMGETGPCGRCSEIHFHRGDAFPCDEEKQGRLCRGLDCSCDRFVEVWNNVFMEFDRQPDGVLKPLPAPSIDTGMGLERITAVIQGKLSNYDTDLFTPILDAIGQRAGRKYGASLDDPGDVSMRVIADHLRAMTFLIADGVVPSNEWRGYVLRKIMRRAMRHGKKLGFTQPILHDLVGVVVSEMEEAYPELRRNHDAIVKVVRSEEDRFDAVLTAGLPRLEEVLDRAAAAGTAVPGDEAFRLYDSLGVPFDFMEDLAGQRQIAIDREGFERAMEGQRVKARAGSTFKGGDRSLSLSMSPALERTLAATADDFAGYDATRVTGTPVVALFDSHGAEVESLPSGATGYASLARTPFYVEAGGQVSDTGRLVGADSEAVVERMIRQPGRPRLHQIRVERGALRAGEIVTAEVTDAVRDATRRNHTATHLLHAALRQVLGPHVKQAGSLVDPTRLRFDFSHFSQVAEEELQEIESIVNREVLANAKVETLEDVPIDVAVNEYHAMALFGEKYGDKVRVVKLSDGFSTELCGGIHTAATGEIGLLKLTSEGAVSSGVRRVEAISGLGSLDTFRRDFAVAQLASQIAPSADGNLSDSLRAKLASQDDELKRLRRELEESRMKSAAGGLDEALNRAVEVKGVKVLTHRADNLERGQLRTLVDNLKQKLGEGVVVLASAQPEGKVAIIAGVTPGLIKRIQAGKLVGAVAKLVGGSGGGKPEIAEAGGKDQSQIAAALQAAPGIIGELLS